MGAPKPQARTASRSVWRERLAQHPAWLLTLATLAYSSPSGGLNLGDRLVGYRFA